MCRDVRALTDVVSVLQYEAVRQARDPEVFVSPQTVQLILYYVLTLSKRKEYLHVVCHTHEKTQTQIDTVMHAWKHKQGGNGGMEKENDRGFYAKLAVHLTHDHINMQMYVIYMQPY